jgi:hypothetical protein
MKKIIRILFSVLGIVSLTALMAVPAFAADEERPSDVDNLQGTAYDTAVKLTWDESTDNEAIEGYQLHYGETPVIETGELYDVVIDAGNVLEYVVTGLENETPYFFSVIAYDAAGNESARWAEELSLIPNEDAGSYEDTEAPNVTNAEALNKEEVKIEFSEEIVIPDEDPQDAFQIEDDDRLEPLAVTDAVMDEGDPLNKTVILTTDEQTEGTTYKLTVTIDIEDKAGNPIISGTSDTAIFTGSGDDKEEADTEGPGIVNVEAQDNTHVLVNFNEKVVLSIDPSENFSIADENDATNTLTVLGVELVENHDDVEDAAALVTTSSQEDKAYILTASDVEDEAGNEIEASTSSAVFEGYAEEAGDDDDDDDVTVEGPQDVTDFIAKGVKEAEKYIVNLTWSIPDVNRGVVAKQGLYISEDNEDYDKETEIDPDSEQYSVEDLEPGEYWFKLTQEDAEGRETEGVITKVILSDTGPGIVGLVMVSLGLGHLINRRKKRK